MVTVVAEALLVSWRDTATRRGIVERVTAEDDSGFVELRGLEPLAFWMQTRSVKVGEGRSGRSEP
jgi:hypothetical protein